MKFFNRMKIIRSLSFIAAIMVSALLLTENCNAQKKTKVVGATIKCEKSAYLSHATPESMGMDFTRLSKVDGVIESFIAKKDFPGAVLAVVRENKIVYLKAYGNKWVYPKTEPMTTDAVFDMASCSKVMGTTMCIMQLFERGEIRLTDNVEMYIPGFKPYVDTATGEKVNIRIVDLLTHSSGLPSYVNPSVIINKYGNSDPASLMDWIANCKRDFRPTTDFQYSCLNFITLQNILQNITGEKLCDFAQKNLFDRLGMEHTTYSPKAQNKTEIMKFVCPTEKQPDGSVLFGEVHDPLARVINKGNSGNAGVFSSAEDIAILVAALMNDGEINGRRVLGKETVKFMTTVPVETEKLGRSLGWDNYSPYASNKGNIFDRTRAYGHTGYTGTSIVIDPVTKTAVILLTNRVHPNDSGSGIRARALVANVVAGSIIK